MDTMDGLYDAAFAYARTPHPNAFRAFARGDLVRLRRGAYVPTDLWVLLDAPSRFALAAAVHAWFVPSAVFCGETSLFLRGLPVVRTPTAIDVAVPTNAQLGTRPPTFEARGDTDMARRARALAPPPLRRHRHSPLVAESVGTLDCIPVSDALVEVLASAKFARALTVADGVLRLDPEVPLLNRAPVAEAIAALTFRSQRERAEGRALLARTGAESPGESVSRALMLTWGFPEPALQTEYRDSLGLIGFADFTWHRIPAPLSPSGRDRLGEFDGWGKYLDTRLTHGEDAVSVLKREKQRENRLLALGHPVLRWDWADLERPARFRTKLVTFGLVPTRSAASIHKCA